MIFFKVIVLAFFIFFFESCKTTKTATVLLTGSGSYDPDGYIIKYAWRQVSGNRNPISNPAAANTTTKVSKGRYSWELTVTDNRGATAKDTTTISF